MPCANSQDACRTTKPKSQNINTTNNKKITANIDAMEARLTQIKIYYNNAVLSSLSFLNLDQA